MNDIMTDPRCQSYQKCVRYAVAINNMGVTLLEKKCYEHAIRTFHDAMALVYQIIQIQHIDTESCALLHRDASQRLIHARPNEHHQTFDFDVIELFSNENTVNSIIQVHTQTDDEEYNRQFNGTFHPIRLEGRYNDSSDLCHNDVMKSYTTDRSASSILSMDVETPKFETSIIFHNLGLAYLGMSFGCLCSEKYTTNARRYRDRAYQCLRKSFVLAKTIIFDRATISTKLSCWDIPILFRGMILVIHSILQMIHFCYDINGEKEDEMNQYITTLDHLIQKLDDTKYWNQQFGLLSAGAGAA
jgi:hypothetical protein